MRAPRKKPVRAFSGLVGLPPESDAQPRTPEPVSAQAISPPAYRSTSDLLNELESEKKAKKAEAARARRKLQADQIKRIKEVLKVPIAQVKSEAAAKTKADKLPSMNSGAFMPDAETGKGEIVTGGYGSAKADYITSLDVGREAMLGNRCCTSDEVTGGRRQGRPEGNAPEKDFSRDEAEFNLRSRGAMQGFSESASRSFQVRLNIDGQYEIQRALDSLLVEYFEGLVCRLCQILFQDNNDAKDHILAVHGDESSPNHDVRFGDLVNPRIKKIERDDRKREKEGKNILTAAQPERRKRAEPEEAHREGWTQTGNMAFNHDKRKWVREWVKNPVTG
jgi:hypothetical protein